MGLYTNNTTSSARSQGEVVRYGPSRLFKVIEICTNRMSICDYLLVFSSKYAYLPSFPRYNDLLVENQRFFAVFTHPTPISFKAIARELPEI